MSLLYYMYLRGNLDRRIEILFLTIQWIWFVSLPLVTVQFYSNFFEKNKLTILILGMIATVIFNYIFYYRETNKNEILKKYTYKHKIIDNYPNTSFFVSHLTIITLGLILNILIANV